MLKRLLILIALCLPVEAFATAHFATPPPGLPGTPPRTGGGASGADRESGVVVLRPGPRRGAAVAALAPSGRPEWVVFGTPGEVARAETALTQAGAAVLSRRSLPTLARRITVFDLRGVSGAQAVAASGSARAAPNTLYRFAQGAGPRLYAAGVVRDGGCRLSPGIRIGVIDGAVDTRHPALAGARVVARDMRVAGQAAASGAHGTAVAGLIAGGGDWSGFAQGAQVLAADAFAAETGGAAADVDRIAGALDWVLQGRALVVNMSFAGPPNTVLAELLGLAARRALLVAASGNSGADASLWPAASAHVIAVTAIDAGRRGYRRATTGPQVEVAAPGVDVWVAKGAGGGYASGTSYAAPVVTSFAARLLARGLTPGAARAALARTAEDLGPKGRDTRFGHGLVVAPGC